MDNINNKPDLKKFFCDPDFHFVLEMLSKNTEGLKDVGTIDMTQSAETIKAIVAGRQETLKLVENFINDIEVYKNITNTNKTPTSFA